MKRTDLVLLILITLSLCACSANQGVSQNAKKTAQVEKTAQVKKTIRIKKTEAAPASVPFTQQEVMKEIRSHTPSMKVCYDKVLSQDPQIQGKIVIQFMITEDGSVDRPKEVTPQFSQILSECVIDVLKRMTFPKPEKGPITIRYPFIFTQPKPKSGSK